MTVAAGARDPASLDASVTTSPLRKFQAQLAPTQLGLPSLGYLVYGAYSKMDWRRFAEIRVLLGRSQAEFAEDLGATANTVARWERGEISIPRTVEKLATLLAERRAPRARYAGVARDRRHQDILDALEGHIDPDAFEACACSLLLSTFPKLVAVRGGSDSGFDGEVAGPDGEITPLIVTTARSYLSNFKRSIAKASMVSVARAALFATSRRITSKRRQELRRVAHEWGLDTLHIFDQDWFGEMLYHDAEWSKRLLGIGGRPVALSPFPSPHTGRFPVAQLLGRDRELERLHAVPTDALVVGGPGFGKTALLEVFAAQRGALFLVDHDRSALADALRAVRPDTVIIDDAHARGDALEQLCKLRSELSQEFKILACVWPLHEERVKKQLSRPTVSTIHLPQLDADTIVEIVRVAGLSGPDLLVRSIVAQSEGRPGLAVTLARICVKGGLAETVWSGQALVEHLCPALEASLDRNVKRLLGCFGLGGKSGVPTETVARLLSQSLDAVSETLAALAPAGVIREGRDGSISVWPEVFRWQLVRYTFSGEGRLDFRPFLENSSNREDAIESLVGARSRGADVPQLESLISDYNSQRLWRAYAQLGRASARTALQSRPDCLLALAPVLLEHIPDEVIPRLLDVHDHERSQVLELFEQWLVRIESVNQMLRRRQILVDSISAQPKPKGTSAFAIEVLLLAINPGFENVSTNPGSGNTVTLTWGLLPPQDLLVLESLWPPILSILLDSPAAPWDAIVNMVDEWRVPDPRVQVGSDVSKQMCAFASRMAKDLVKVAGLHFGARHRVAQLLASLQAESDIDLGVEFASLYPLDNWGGEKPWEVIFSEWSARAAELGRMWSLAAPSEIASKLVQYERQATEAKVRASSMVSIAVREIARAAPRPDEFLSCFVAHKISSDHLWPLALESAKHKSSSTIQLLLASSGYENLALELYLATDTSDLALLREVLARATNAESLVESYMRRIDDIDVARCLLSDSRSEVSLSAAVGEWHGSQLRAVRESLEPEWRNAILLSARGMEDRHFHKVRAILDVDAQLACDWLCIFVAEDYPNRYRLLELATSTTARLNGEQRSRVLNAIVGDGFLHRLVAHLVGDNLNIYEECLTRTDLRTHQLEPIACGFNERWADKLILARRYGYDVAQLADASFPSMRAWSGNESDYWRPYLTTLQSFVNHGNEWVRAVAIECLSAVEQNIDRSLKRERTEAIRGYAARD